MTYSIAACDLDAGQWGVATQSKFLAVGSIVPWAEPHVGAIATQAWANPQYGPEGLRLLRGGFGAQEVMENLVFEDDGREHRQVGVVDARGVSASYTGSECMTWAGHTTGVGFSAQGNILVSGATVDALAGSFSGSAGRPLAERLLEALDAAQAAGGDRRGQQSAALLVVAQGGGYAGLSDTLVDLRVDDHATPLDELRRLYEMHHLLFGKTPGEEWIDVNEELAGELRERLARLGYDGALETAFVAWAGTENLEERVNGAGRIDPVVLEELREAMTDAPGWQAIHVDQLEAIPIAEGVVWRPLRRRLGIRAFGTNAYTSEGVGQHIVEDHDELGGGAGGHEEMYVVVRGRAKFTIDGEDLDAPAGTIVFIQDPALKRVAFEEEEGTVVLAVGGEPGHAYEVSPWEHTFASIPLLRAERWEDAAAVLEAGLREHPENASLLYNLACAESQSGRVVEALTHLQEAIRRHPPYRRTTAADPDFDPIRHEPGFPA